MGSYTALNSRSGATGAVSVGDKTITLMSNAQLDKLCATIQGAAPVVNVETDQPTIHVEAPQQSLPVVQVHNEVETPSVDITNMVTLKPHHLYYAAIVHAALLIILGIGAYVAVSEYNEYTDSAYRSEYFPGE